MPRKCVCLALFACSTGLCSWAQRATVSIDSATAIHVAENLALEIYGKEEIDAEQPLTVLRNRGTWEVYGTPCCPDRNGLHTCQADRCIGGVIHVSIRQKDGQVLSIERKVLPRVTFTWPDDATPQTVIYEWGNGWCGGSSGSYNGQGKQFIVGGLCGYGPMRHAKLAIYASGCQSQKFDLDLPASEVTKALRCDPLPDETLRGFIPPDQIPRVRLNQGPVLRQLDISADLETTWMHDFLYGALDHIVEHISLNKVGVLDPARNGDFEITIPAFSHDPSYTSYAASGRSYGLIKFQLRDPLSGARLGGLVPVDSFEPGLNVEGEYPYIVMFKVVR